MWVLLDQTRGAIYRARSKELAKYGISPRQSAVLFYIRLLGSRATAGELSLYLVREPHTTSEILKRMQKAGLVRRSITSEKKRQIKFILTDKGMRIAKESIKRTIIKEIFSCLSEEETKLLRPALLKLRHQALQCVMMADLEYPLQTGILRPEPIMHSEK